MLHLSIVNQENCNNLMASSPIRQQSRVEVRPACILSVSSSWLTVGTHGLRCRPGGFHIDPHCAVDRAMITHGHSDMRVPVTARCSATPETIAVMKARLGENSAGSFQAAPPARRSHWAARPCGWRLPASAARRW